MGWVQWQGWCHGQKRALRYLRTLCALEAAIQDGNDIVVPYTKDRVKDAPRVAPDGHLEAAEEDQLYTYYGLSGRNAYTGTGRETTARDTSARGAVGHDTSGPTTDDAMSRSEEQLHVGTRNEEAGRARLRNFVVTENVTTTVPVQREEVRIEREPITEANRGKATAGPDISVEEHEVILPRNAPWCRTKPSRLSASAWTRKR